MADTTLPLNAGSGGAELAVDDIASAVYQYVGLAYGGSGSKTAVSNANPLPVKIGDGTDYALVNGSGELTVKHTDAIPVTDNGGSLTVDGTVAVTNAGLTALNGAITGTEVQVDVLTLPPVTGTVDLGATDNGVLDSIAASVAAIDTDATTIIGHVDGLEGLLTTIDADTGNIATSAATIAGAVSGTEMRVDVVAALPAGNNVIGQVKLTDGTDVADVLDLTSSNPLAVAIVDTNGDQISSFGGGTQYTEADTDASITGTAILWEDTSDTLRAVSAAKPLPVAIISAVSPVGATNVATGQAAPTNSAATLVASRATRTRLTLVNRGSVSVYVGPATVTTANGVELKPGESMTFEMAGTTLQGITASGTGNIHYWEEYN